MLMYILIFFASLIFCMAGFAAYPIDRSVEYLRRGEQPPYNMGACVFPTIPFIPAFFMSLAWLMNKLWPYGGKPFILGFLCLIIVASLVHIWKMRRELSQIQTPSQVSTGGKGTSSSSP